MMRETYVWDFSSFSVSIFSGFIISCW
jgi:hypothetical protein